MLIQINKFSKSVALCLCLLCSFPSGGNGLLNLHGLILTQFPESSETAAQIFTSRYKSPDTVHIHDAEHVHGYMILIRFVLAHNVVVEILR